MLVLPASMKSVAAKSMTKGLHLCYECLPTAQYFVFSVPAHIKPLRKCLFRRCQFRFCPSIPIETWWLSGDCITKEIVWTKHIKSWHKSFVHSIFVKQRLHKNLPIEAK